MTEAPKKDLYWLRFVALYENCQKPLNARDWRNAAVRFYRYSEEDQRRIVAWVEQQMVETWRDPKFTPMPVQALLSEGWTRTAKPRPMNTYAGFCAGCGYRMTDCECPKGEGVK